MEKAVKMVKVRQWTSNCALRMKNQNEKMIDKDSNGLDFSTATLEARKQ